MLAFPSRALPLALRTRHFTSTAIRKMKVIPVPVREDNYAYLLVDENAKKAAAVDPYDVPKVVAAAKNEGLEIIAALTTHKHHDHAGGNEVCANLWFSGLN